MKRNSIAHIYQLQPGDRFCIRGERKKSVWQLEKIEMRYIRGFKIRFADCINDSKEKRTFKADRSIIFLRNINDHAIT